MKIPTMPDWLKALVALMGVVMFALALGDGNYPRAILLFLCIKWLAEPRAVTIRFEAEDKTR